MRNRTLKRMADGRTDLVFELVRAGKMTATSTLRASALGCLFLAQAGCGLFGPGDREFVIGVDSVRGPSVVAADVAFDQRFYGPVGPHGCYSFVGFRVIRSAAAADVILQGQQRRGSIVCTQEPVYLYGAPLTIAPPVTDPFVLRVHQPDGTVLTRTIRVQDGRPVGRG